MRIEFDLSYTSKKALAHAVSEITGADCRYLGMPSGAYRIDYFTVNRDGALEFDDRADSEGIEDLLDRLEEKGFIAVEQKGKEVSENSSKREFNETEQNEVIGLTIEISLDKVNVGKLTALLESKGRLIQKALGIKATPIEICEDRVSFPWFDEIPDSETAKAYTHFISAICKMTTEQKRINRTQDKSENEKYAFRCFLLRLGFIGEEYKAERKILLKNLTGSSAFRSTKGEN